MLWFLLNTQKRSIALKIEFIFKINLYQTNLYQTNLYQTNLYQTNLYQTNLYQTNLHKSNFCQQIYYAETNNCYSRRF